MAGEWLKMEASTPDKPEVLALTVRMGWDDPDLTVGKLFRLWRWFDQQTTDGNAAGVTPALLDRQVGVSGFIEAVASVGWLSVTDAGVTLINFDRHNGATAKSRSQTAKRVANHKTNATGNAKGNAATVSGALPREEKRREDSTEAKASVTRPSKKCPASFELTAELLIWAETEFPMVSTKDETDKMRDHTFSTARVDWAGTWRNWIRKAGKDMAEREAVETFKERDARNARKRWEETTGRPHSDNMGEFHTVELHQSNILEITND